VDKKKMTEGFYLDTIDKEIAIQLIIYETHCTKEVAIEALNITNNDIVTAIMVEIYNNFLSLFL